jgi:hypothetical protein
MSRSRFGLLGWQVRPAVRRSGEYWLIRNSGLLRRVQPETEPIVTESRQRFNSTLRRHLGDKARRHLSARGKRCGGKAIQIDFDI